MIRAIHPFFNFILMIGLLHSATASLISGPPDTRCIYKWLFSILLVLNVNAECCMRNCAQTFLGNKFTRFAAYSVCFVLNTDQCCLKMLDKLHLALCQPSVLLFFRK